MRAVNHTVTGAVIGAAVANPILAVTAALLSHLVLDIIPHSSGPDKKSKAFLYHLVIDAAMAAAFLMFLVLSGIPNWQLLTVCGIIAASPDLLWFRHWLSELKNKPVKYNKLEEFLARIQWCERPWGIYIEAVWLVLSLAVFFAITS